MSAYYNEIDSKAAAWLRELIKAGLIAPGDVDERDLWDVKPRDLEGFTQHHFFAGIGVWSYALRRAGWSDNRPVWTGSAPCQPFSTAGKGEGFDDERHLWPAWHWLIQERRPPVIFGEQVASKLGRAWFDLVSTDLEALGYAIGAGSVPACGVGAPHIRQRLYFVADAERRTTERHGHEVAGAPGGVQGTPREQRFRDDTRDGSESGPVGHNKRQRLERHGRDQATGRRDVQERPIATPGPTNGFWRDAEWIWCRDEKWRPTEPGTFPLAHGAPERVGRLRGYGNAIVAEVAEAFIKAYLNG